MHDLTHCGNLPDEAEATHPQGLEQETYLSGVSVSGGGHGLVLLPMLLDLVQFKMHMTDELHVMNGHCKGVCLWRSAFMLRQVTQVLAE